MSGLQPARAYGRAAAAPAGSFAVIGIEVTQTIQDMRHTVTLIAGKTTVVRVYLERPDPVAADVRGEVEVSGAHGVITVPSLDRLNLDPAHNGDLTGRRHDLTKSLNFLLPAATVQPGRISVQVTRIITVGTGLDLAEALPRARAADFDFLESPPLRIRIVRIRHRVSGKSKIFEPSAIDYELILSWLRRAYPVHEVLATRVTTDAARLWPFNATEINAQVTGMRNNDLAAGGDPRVRYIAIVADGADAQNRKGTTFMRGSVSTIPANHDLSAVGSAPVGPWAYPWDTDGSYGDWYVGHELGHTFGREHVGTCKGITPDRHYVPANGALSGPSEEYVGFDTGDAALGLPMRPYRGTQYHDVMSYCDYLWLSAFTYEAIRQRIASDAGRGFAPRSATRHRPAHGPDMPSRTALLNIVGTVDLTDRKGSIDYVQPMDSGNAQRDTDRPPPDMEGPPQDNTQRVSLRLYGPQAGSIATVPARVKFDTDSHEDQHERGVVDTLVRVPSNLDRVELLIDEQPVARYGFRREAFLPDGRFAYVARALRYTIQVSTDGEHWLTVAVGLQDPYSFVIDPEDFAGSERIHRRVLATDGLRTRVISADVLAIPLERPHG